MTQELARPRGSASSVADSGRIDIKWPRVSAIPAVALALALSAIPRGGVAAQTADATVAASAAAGTLATRSASDDAAEAAKFAYFETLGEKGWDVSRPSTADTVVADTLGIRSKLAEYGIGFLGIAQTKIAADTLHQSGGTQYYDGQVPTYKGAYDFSVSLSTDRYGIPGGQFTAAMTSSATTWKPLGPRATSLQRLWYYQSLFGGRLELKAGYIVEPVEFYGQFIGGNIITGVLGPNASILNQVGTSRAPLTAPGANARLNLPDHLYVKVGVQRSIDPAGAQPEHDANPTGFLFHTPNARALAISEIGYKQPASVDERSFWIRGGALYNNSPYTVFGTPRTSPNHALIGLADLQLIKTDVEFPARGIYGGLTFISGDPNVDGTSRNYEARLFGIGLVPGRPRDFVSLVYDNTRFSAQSQAMLRSQGIPAFTAINNVTASYSAHLTRGIFLISGLIYADHAAATNIGRPALVFSNTLSIIF